MGQPSTGSINISMKGQPSLSNAIDVGVQSALQSVASRQPHGHGKPMQLRRPAMLPQPIAARTAAQKRALPATTRAPEQHECARLRKSIKPVGAPGAKRKWKQFGIGSTEHLKHGLYRKAHDMVDGTGAWCMHSALADHKLPAMTPRALDVLNIIYIKLERLGVDPASAKQVWSLDQSIARRSRKGEELTVEALANQRPCIPGFHPADALEAIVPCILPRSRLWVNALQRFLSGTEALRLNGLWWDAGPPMPGVTATLAHQAAGNSFSMTTACAHLSIAMAHLLPTDKVLMAGKPHESELQAQRDDIAKQEKVNGKTMEMMANYCINCLGLSVGH